MLLKSAWFVMVLGSGTGCRSLVPGKSNLKASGGRSAGELLAVEEWDDRWRMSACVGNG